MLSKRPVGTRAGLSLLELLVSLALLALIAGGLAGAFGVGTQVFDRAQSLNTHESEIAARRQLRTALMQALPTTRITPFPNSFAGAPDTLEFVSLSDAAFAYGSAALQFNVTWTGKNLNLTITAVDDEGVAIEAWEHRLSGDLQNVVFRYLDTNGDAPIWETSWADRPGLPALIQITGEGGTPAWVTFTVAPRLQPGQ